MPPWGHIPQSLEPYHRGPRDSVREVIELVAVTVDKLDAHTDYAKGFND